jgi:hypothetical protein
MSRLRNADLVTACRALHDSDQGRYHLRNQIFGRFLAEKNVCAPESQS